MLEPVRTAAAEAGAISFNLQVAVPAYFEISTELARLMARGELRVVGTRRAPGVLGRLEALPGGELEVADVRYELAAMRRDLHQPRRHRALSSTSRPAPRCRLRDHRGAGGHPGPHDADLHLEPAAAGDGHHLAPLDGQRADEAASAQAGTVASTFLTDQLTSAMTRRARTLLDVDQLRVDPFAATENGEPTARLTVVKQLAKRWTVHGVDQPLVQPRAGHQEPLPARRRGSSSTLRRQEDGSYFAEVQWQHRY